MGLIKKVQEFGVDNGLDILVISGVHGNETHAVAAVKELYDSLDYSTIAGRVSSITFIFNLNEYGLEQDTRNNNYEKEESKNCNRLFPNEYLTSSEIKEYIKNLDYNYDLILDVHNSYYCIPCVLVDYDENTYRLLGNLSGTELIPLVRCTQIGTIKKYFNRNGWNAYTVELPKMGVCGDIKESARLLKQFIERVSDNIYNNNFKSIEITQDIITQNLYTRTPNGIIKYARKVPVGEYKKDEIICEVVNLSDDCLETIRAPYDGILYDIEDNIYSYEGKPFGIYGKILIIDEVK